MQPAENWVSDNVSFLIGTGLGVVGILIGYILYRRALRPKVLDFTVSAVQAILNTEPSDVGSGLRVSWTRDSSPEIVLQEPKLYTIRIKNTGKVAIDASDFVQPVLVRAPPAEYIVEASIVAVSHVGIHSIGVLPNDSMSPNNKSGIVRVSPGLLNARDWIDVRVVTDRRASAEGERLTRQQEITVESRIRDQTRSTRNYQQQLEPLIKSMLPRPTRREVINSAIIGVPILILVATILVAVLGNRSLGNALFVVITFPFFIMFAMLAMGLIVALPAFVLIGLTWSLQRLGVRLLQKVAERWPRSD